MNMNIVKSFSRRSFFWLFLIMMILLATIYVSIYMAVRYVFMFISIDQIRTAIAEVPNLEEAIEQLWPVIEWVHILFIPVTAGVFFLFFLISWLVVRKILVRVLRREESGQLPVAEQERTGKVKKKKKRKSSDIEFPEDKVEEDVPSISVQEAQEKQRRYYLHLLSVLQREGRLVDFLQEELGPYNDAQIGAAVRSIHENCKKSLEKHLSPLFVMDKDEGETVTVPVDFDSSVIKLTGNVTGEPPFTGILRHKGWRAGKLELPVLSASGDVKIIAPAEVEIV